MITSFYIIGVYYSQIIISFNPVESELLEALLNKPDIQVFKI